MRLLFFDYEVSLKDPPLRCWFVEELEMFHEGVPAISFKHQGIEYILPWYPIVRIERAEDAKD